MADTKLTGLAALPAGQSQLGDLLYVVDDPTGTPSSRSIQLQHVLPQATTAQMNAIAPAANERPFIYNTDLEIPVFWNGTAWRSLIDGLPV